MEGVKWKGKESETDDEEQGRGLEIRLYEALLQTH